MIVSKAGSVTGAFDGGRVVHIREGKHLSDWNVYLYPICYHIPYKVRRPTTHITVTVHHMTHTESSRKRARKMADRHKLITSDQTSGRPGYRLLSCGRIESALPTRSELEVIWIAVAEDNTNGFGKVLRSDGS